MYIQAMKLIRNTRNVAASLELLSQRLLQKYLLSCDRTSGNNVFLVSLHLIELRHDLINPTILRIDVLMAD